MVVFGRLAFWGAAFCALPAIQLNWMARYVDKINASEAATRLAVAVILSPLLFVLLRAALRRLVDKLPISAEGKARYVRLDNLTYVVWWLLLAGSVGVQMDSAKSGLLFVAFLLLQATLFAGSVKLDAIGKLSGLFLVSGMAALIYQIAWQRVLFSAFGVNIESVTIIVSIFMFGLGIGALAGGILSKRATTGLPTLFLVCEICIGIFGLLSIPLIRWASEVMVMASTLQMALTTYVLLALPTTFMGATLPILVEHLNRHFWHVGRSVGTLYFVNTLGSAIACFAAAHVLFVVTGLRGATLVAACLNIAVGVAVYRTIIAQRRRNQRGSPEMAKAA